MKPSDLPPQIFVTGTDTNVGKTVVCAALLSGLPNACYWKPVQSGCEEGTDSQWIRQVTGLPAEKFFPETHLLKAPLSPHAAAMLENKQIALSDFQAPDTSAPLIVEGAGGIMVPINNGDLMLDLVKSLGYPVLLVARSTLGTINHTLLSLDKLAQARVPVCGVVLNGPQNASNKQAIEKFGRTKVLMELEPLAPITRQALKKAFEAAME